SWSSGPARTRLSGPPGTAARANDRKPQPPRSSTEEVIWACQAGGGLRAHRRGRLAGRLARGYVHHAGDRRGAGEPVFQRIDSRLRTGQLHQLLPLAVLFIRVDAHGVVTMLLQRLVALPFPVEGPHQHRLPQRQVVAGLAVVTPGVPGVPGLAIADRKSTRLNSSHVKISYAVF